jgi:hypothetical protein
LSRCFVRSAQRLPRSRQRRQQPLQIFGAELGRRRRIGQDQPVFVYKLVVQGSIEERMLALQTRKAALAEGVLGVDAAAASKFSAEDLQGLLAPLG